MPVKCRRDCVEGNLKLLVTIGSEVKLRGGYILKNVLEQSTIIRLLLVYGWFLPSFHLSINPQFTCVVRAWHSNGRRSSQSYSHRGSSRQAPCHIPPICHSQAALRRMGTPELACWLCSEILPAVQDISREGLFGRVSLGRVVGNRT